MGFVFTRFLPFLFSPGSWTSFFLGRSGPSPSSSILASETLVSSSPEALRGSSEDVASTERPGRTTHVFYSFSQGLSGSRVRRLAFHKELRSSQRRPSGYPLEILSIPD